MTAVYQNQRARFNRIFCMTHSAYDFKLGEGGIAVFCLPSSKSSDRQAKHQHRYRHALEDVGDGAKLYDVEWCARRVSRIVASDLVPRDGKVRAL